VPATVTWREKLSRALLPAPCGLGRSLHTMSRTKTWQKRLRAKKEAEKARAAAERTAEAAAQAALEESHLKHRAWPPDEEELHRLACMESSESEAEAEAMECCDGGVVPRSAAPRSAEAPLHALAGKTLRLRYALSVDKAELVVKHLLAVAYSGDAVAVDALARALPRAAFPERVVRPGACRARRLAAAHARAQEERCVAMCMRCRVHFEPQRPGGCRLEHEWLLRSGTTEDKCRICHEPYGAFSGGRACPRGDHTREPQRLWTEPQRRASRLPSLARALTRALTGRAQRPRVLTVRPGRLEGGKSW